MENARIPVGITIDGYSIVRENANMPYQQNFTYAIIVV